MPTIYDNIEKTLINGLREMLVGARRADFCVGYFNLRGWSQLENAIHQLSGENGKYCRLLVGMATAPKDSIRQMYQQGNARMTQSEAAKQRSKIIHDFADQLTIGVPTNKDEQTLQRLVKQLRDNRLQVKLFTRHPLHAKLYLAHRADNVAALAGFVGSSNLTLSGLEKNGELNVDVLEQDAAHKLAHWFEERWRDDWSIDISADLADIIENSWAGGAKPPYHIYIKTAWHLSHDAVSESAQFRLPPDLAKTMLEHQKQAVSFAAQRLNHQRGVIIGDVVGLGKTLVATAVAKVFQEDRSDSVLVICPPALESNWEKHLHKYQIAGRVMSSGRIIKKLPTMRRYRLLIIDESHNFRNSKSGQHGILRDYIHNNESRVMLLTATPYNKSYEDIASQLQLFLKRDDDLDIYPEALLKAVGGKHKFNSKHPNTSASSLAAFEKSEYVDDWRELMRLFMVRRTRAHIKQNYAEYDDVKKRHYLTFADDSRYYFPHRKTRPLDFKMQNDDADDQYAILYSEKVINIIGKLALPRYGLKQYLNKIADTPENDGDKTTIDNLSRAGKRMIGFARTGLFKRLESGGDAFLLSVRRHILRNAMMMAAIQNGKKLPIGQLLATTIDDIEEKEEEKENSLFAAPNTRQDWDEDELLNAGKKLYETIKTEHAGDFSWISCGYFRARELKADLLSDCERLLSILALTPQWDASKDRKLTALQTLCQQQHSGEKILVFTQFKDTVEYLHRNLQDNIPQLATAHGDTKDIGEVIAKFSPTANGESVPPLQQTRVLITTDKLSEGVNLQDAHIVVNYDLPWAIIRLSQRAGRLDRIGQQADTIYCYSALPENGIEKIIKLRHRLRQRMKQNAELIGSDERFFDGDEENSLRSLYANNTMPDDEEGETDLVSYAHDIWRQAIKRDPSLKKKIEAMPDVVYSAKAVNAKADAADGENDTGNADNRQSGVIGYVQDSRGHQTLAHIGDDGQIISQSQYKILDAMACEPQEKPKDITPDHHKLVAKMAEDCRTASLSLAGGQLGGESSPRRRVYNKLSAYLEQSRRDTPLLTQQNDDIDDIKKAVQQLYKHPLRDTARDKLGRQLRSGIQDQELAEMVISLWRAENLCQTPKNDGDDIDVKIICSMGLITT